MGTSRVVAHRRRHRGFVHAAVYPPHADSVNARVRGACRYPARPQHIAVRIERGGGTGPLKPRQPPRHQARERCQFHQAAKSLGDVGSRFQPLPQNTAEVFYMAARVTDSARNVGPSTRSRRATSASAASARSRSSYDFTRARSTPPSCAAGSRRARRTSGATRDFLPFDGPPRARHALPAGWTPLVPRRPAGRAARPARGLGQERRRQPDALVQGPRRRRRARARASSATRRRLRLDRQPGERRRRARRGRRAGVLRLHPVRPRGAEDPRDRRLRHDAGRRQGNYDDVNRLCTELSGERDWAFVNVNMRPVLRRGLEDARLRDRRAARLASCPTGSSRRSPRARCSRRSPAASRSGSSSA